jgi:hypothetical protein
MVPASLSLEIVTSLSEQQKTVRTDAMVYNELTDVDAGAGRGLPQPAIMPTSAD